MNGDDEEDRPPVWHRFLDLTTYALWAAFALGVGIGAPVEFWMPCLLLSLATWRKMPWLGVIIGMLFGLMN